MCDEPTALLGDGDIVRSSDAPAIIQFPNCPSQYKTSWVISEGLGEYLPSDYIAWQYHNLSRLKKIRPIPHFLIREYIRLQGLDQTLMHNRLKREQEKRGGNNA
jgi:hypothetical protein